jgi:hypothetical protein
MRIYNLCMYVLTTFIYRYADSFRVSDISFSAYASRFVRAFSEAWAGYGEAYLATGFRLARSCRAIHEDFVGFAGWC